MNPPKDWDTYVDLQRGFIIFLDPKKLSLLALLNQLFPSNEYDNERPTNEVNQPLKLNSQKPFSRN